MNFTLVRPICALLVLWAWATPLSAERWRAQFFYDQEKSNLTLVDLQFPSPARGVAIGVIQEGRREKPVCILTSDGGANWQTVELKETPVSLFFLNETLGWMVTEKGGLWQTTEAGRNWRKLPKVPANILRVYFLNEKTGWAAGAKKKVLETQDGGEHWTAVGAAAEPPGNADYSTYNWIAFATPQIGMISGWNIPPRRMPQERPDWVDPESAISRRDLPHLTYSLVTHDGGKTWKADSASLIGEVVRIRFNPSGTGLGLLQYSNAFRYPSEVYRIDWTKGGKSSTVYRDRRFNITDVWITPDGTAYLAGTLVTGQLRNVAPAKVRVLRSRDLMSWEELEVDYRAVANRVTLSGTADGNVWLATDQGMILKLAK